MDFPEALRRYGVDLHEHGDWRRHERPGWFSPVGVMIHHTAAGGTDEWPSLGTVTKGRAGVPPPLCNLLGGRGTGRMLLISDGRASDSGMGSKQVLDAVRRNTAPSDTAARRGLPDDINGNPYFYDIELENNGIGEPWASELVEGAIRASHAICVWQGWHQNRIISHAEWTRRKIDPRGIDMSAFRYEVGRRLHEPVAPPPPQSPPQSDSSFKERVMSLPVLSQGAQGQYVRILQGLLCAHAGDLAIKYSNNDINRFVDGAFGPTTQRTLVEWQARTNALTPDGTCGPATWSWLVGV